MTTITIYKSSDCGACREIVPAVERLADKKGFQVRIVDVDECGKPCDSIKFVPLIKIGRRTVDMRELAEMLK